MKEIFIDGNIHVSMSSIHKLLAKEMNFGPFYGENFSALWDLLTTEVERPFHIKVINAIALKESLGEDFTRLINIFKKLERYDEEMELDEKFHFSLS